MLYYFVDRDCARWKLPPAEVQKRRALFWELFITDCWQVRHVHICRQEQLAHCTTEPRHWAPCHIRPPIR